MLTTVANKFAHKHKGQTPASELQRGKAVRPGVRSEELDDGVLLADHVYIVPVKGQEVSCRGEELLPRCTSFTKKCPLVLLNSCSNVSNFLFK